MQDEQQILEQAEAAAFRRLLRHLQEHTEAQNIDLMILADFCRNCLSTWYREAAAERGIELSKDDARKHVYGMSYDDWKEQHQAPASPEKLAEYKARRPS